jgi:hypothetical protein
LQAIRRRSTAATARLRIVVSAVQAVGQASGEQIGEQDAGRARKVVSDGLDRWVLRVAPCMSGSGVTDDRPDAGECHLERVAALVATSVGRSCGWFMLPPRCHRDLAQSGAASTPSAENPTFAGFSDTERAGFEPAMGL